MAEGAEAPLVVIAAGGTGGHLFPAEALSVALRRRGIAVDLATDVRAARYGANFPAREIHLVPSATLRGRDVISAMRTAARLSFGIARAFGLLGRLRPAIVVGFGGYPTVPPVLAAVLRGIPTLIHEQNGVMGRANRLLAPYVRAIATGFPAVLDRQPNLAAKATHTGNPVRPAVAEAAQVPYRQPDRAGPVRLLVFGGSQGAQIMADVVPAAIELLPVAVRVHVTVVQQARAENVAAVRDFYTRLGVPAEVEPFFPDLPARMAQTDLVISRSGASTVAELAAIGRPSILVPLPHALDQDQLANANALQRAGGAIRLDQGVFTPERLAEEIAALAVEPDRLGAMAEAAKRLGATDAAERLADLVLRVAGLEAERIKSE
jgi:UDP-N-acetylglucosamine--N-acetylmuramyl-(pentapeptide) pyrophosphoryl-undecaprenol N-acetylglucosamine transferase